MSICYNNSTFCGITDVADIYFSLHKINSFRILYQYRNFSTSVSKTWRLLIAQSVVKEKLILIIFGYNTNQYTTGLTDKSK
jgi:hypothetical protein